MRFKSLIVGFVIATISGCISEFDIQSIQFERILVVDGYITNEEKEHEIRLSYSYPLDEESLAPVGGAEVVIMVDNNEKIELIESEPGIYKTEPDFSAQSERSYRLQVKIGDNEIYESSSKHLMPDSRIDSLYAEYINTDTREGIEVYADSKGLECSNCYFKYDFEEDYKIETPLGSQFEYVEGEGVVQRVSSISICYAHDLSSSLSIGSSDNNSEGLALRVPINFLSGESQKIRTRYSILVKQHSIDLASYTFYSNLIETNESGGTLFDRQPGTLKGNIFSVEGDQKVLGFFDVSRVTEKRLFVSPSDFYEEGFSRPDFLYDCTFDDLIQFNDSADIAEFAIRSGGQYDIFTVQTEPITGLDPGTYFVNKNCGSCDWYADLTPPEFWEE